MGGKTRYAMVGIGSRAGFFYTAIARDFAAAAEIAAFCDTNQTRMDYANRRLVDEFHRAAVPTYKAAQFDAMIRDTAPDVVIVTSIDRTHDLYIVRAM
jgi:predicted dehydrogenase